MNKSSKSISAAFLMVLVASFSDQTPLEATELKGETFGDWVLACDENDEPARNCGMSQIAKLAQTGEQLLRLDIVFAKANHIRFILPLGTDLNTPPKLYQDGSFKRSLQVDYCLSDGCYFETELRTDQLEDVLRMYSGRLELISGSGDAFSIPISGTGSRAAYNAYRAKIK